MQSALKYRAQAPLIDSLLKELGFGGGDPASLSQALARDTFHAGNGAARNAAATPKAGKSAKDT